MPLQLAPSPSAADINWRRSIQTERDVLIRLIHAGQGNTGSLPDLHTTRRAPTPYDSGIPRPTTAATQSMTMLTRYDMLTGAAPFSLRNGRRAASRDGNSRSVASSASFGSLSLGKQTWQPTSRNALAALPAASYVEARWPSIKIDSTCSAPCRPTQREAARALQEDNMRWIGGSWRVDMARRSPRPTIF